jgi:hypothetical protein
MSPLFVRPGNEWAQLFAPELKEQFTEFERCATARHSLANIYAF